LLTIRDDDLPPTISVGDVSLPEANTTMIFPVSLSAPSGLDIRVEYATYDIGPVGATAGADYVAASDVLTLPAGSTSASIPVTILDDLTYELDEPFGLDISAPGATPGDLAALGTILNNDDPPQIQFETGAYSVSEGAGTVVLTVTLTGPTALTATVDYETRSGTATAGEDYSASSGTLTLSPGGIPPAVTVTMTDDLVYEENETFTVILTNAMNASLGITQALVTVYDDDPMPKIGFSSNVYTVTEHAGSVTITVILTPTSEVTATVNYVTSDGTATAGNDYVATNGTLIVVPGVLSNTFTVSITDDLVYEGPETFKVTLTNAVSASLGITQAVVTVLEHDAVVSFSPTAYSVEEDAGRADLTVTLVPATEVTATVSYETRDGTATAGEDYFASSGTLTLCPGGTPATVKVPMMDDLVYEGPETLTVILTNAVNASLGITEALITIDDDDPMPEIDFSSAAYTITEDRGKAVLTVTLSSPSEVTATVNYETHDGTATAGQDYIASSGTLTFIPGATLQTFTVSIADDGLCEGQESIRLSLTNATDAVLGANKAVLTILDPTTLAVDILGSPYAVLDHNNPESEGPHVLVVQGVVTNTGSCAALAPSIRLDGYEDSDTGWLLLMGELPVRRARTLGPGEAYHAYWFATYPPIIGIGHTYTVTAQAANADPVSTSGNRFAPGDPTVQTVGALEGGTSDEQRPFLETRVGIFMTTTVRWDLGANARAAVFSPVGNVDFDPTSLRLVGARLTFTTGVSSEVVHNRLFATVPDGADEARCELVFLTLRPAVTGICPYAALHYQQNLKYDKDYCQPAIPISSTLGITMTKSANASEVQTGDLLTYTIAYTNTGSDRVRHVWIWDNIDPDIGNITSASGEPAVLSSSQVAWNICDGVAPTGEIGSTGAFTFTIRVTANGATPSGTQQIVNHAFLGIDPAGLPSHPALTSTVTITLASPLSATRLALGRIRTEANSPLASRVWTANSYASSWHTLCVSPGAAAPSPIHPWESSPVDWCSNCTCRFAGAFDPRPRAIVSLSWAEAARHVHPWPE
jgi:uncharacterized repeat protein (TIGR01451 family)